MGKVIKKLAILFVLMSVSHLAEADPFDNWIISQREKCSFLYLDGSSWRRCGFDTFARIKYGTDQESAGPNRSYSDWVNTCVNSGIFGGKFLLGPDTVYVNGYVLIKKLEQFYVDVAEYYDLEFPRHMMIDGGIPVIWMQNLKNGSIGHRYPAELGEKISQALLCLFGVDSLDKVYGVLEDLCDAMLIGIVYVIRLQKDLYINSWTQDRIVELENVVKTLIRIGYNGGLFHIDPMSALQVIAELRGMAIGKTVDYSDLAQYYIACRACGNLVYQGFLNSQNLPLSSVQPQSELQDAKEDN